MARFKQVIFPLDPPLTAPNNRDKKVLFKNCAPFTEYIREINTKELDQAKATDVVMPMYNLTEYSDDYSKIFGGLCQHCRDEPFINNNGVIIDVLDDPDSALFKSKQKITSQAGNEWKKDF